MTLLELQPVSETHVQKLSSRPSLKKRLSALNSLFVLTVVVPTVIAVVYFGLITSDVFVSESRFVVRSPQRQAPSGLGALLQGAGFSRSQDDTYSVHDFMLSRDALKQLDSKLQLAKAFASPDVDLFSRFAAFGIDDNFEALHRYYQKRVGIDTDSTSAISVLRVSAYRAEDAYRINAMLLEMGESLINQLNERGRQDMIRFASAEVDIAEKKAKAAGLALSGYRNDKAVFDPERQSALQLQLVSKLQDELIATKAQLDQVRTFTPENPQIPALQRRVKGLQAEMDTQMGRVAGSGTSLTTKAADYERLALDRTFADKQLGAAFASLEQARNDAQRKQLYLERIVQPSKPDVAVEPRRLRAIFATFVLGLICWGVLTILVAGVREHKD
jgi:capsular polysaccharide transport system permease protein